MQSHNTRLCVLAIALIGIAAVCTPPARAALGADAASVALDAGELDAVVHASFQSGFELREIRCGNGMRVREFLDERGVFAVSWSGPAAPDLHRLLGAHFAAYAAALAALEHPGTHRALRIAASGLIVESTARMREFSGRAYLSGAIPAGVSLADLR